MLPSHLCSDVTRVTRLLKIIARLRQRQPEELIGRKRLAEEFGCTSRTIQRDIELLQMYMHLPLTYERASKTYRLEPEGRAVFSVNLTAEEALALAVARGLLTVPGFPLKERILLVAGQKLGPMPGLSQMSVGTIHSVCLALLKRHLPRYASYRQAFVCG